MRTIFFIFIVVYLAAIGYAAEDNLYELFKDYYQIKVFLKEIVNETDRPDVKVALFKDVFKDVLKERINIEFIPVESKEEADVIIFCKIKDYEFTEEALPIRAAPLFINVVTIVADTAEPKSAARLVVDYEIRRPKDDAILYSYGKFTTEVRKPIEEMKDEMGFAHAARENANRFIFRAFYEKRDR